MKKLLFIFVILLFGIVLHAQTPYYYYYDEEKQYLELHTEYAFLSLTDTVVPEDILQRNITFTDFKSDNVGKKEYQGKKGISRYYTRIRFEDTLTEKQYWNLLSDIKLQNREIIISPYFKTAHGEKIGLSNFFYVKLKEQGDTVLLRQMATQNGCIIIEQNSFMPLWFVVSTTEASDLDALECCKVFYEADLFQYAEPDLMMSYFPQPKNNPISEKKWTLQNEGKNNGTGCVNDPYFNLQWGLKNTGQRYVYHDADSGDSTVFYAIPGIDIKACEAWQLSTGKNVKIAIIDTGIDETHPDLTDNMDSLSYVCTTNSFSSPPYDDHGTQCAGIAGAVQNNNEGISGVAPDSKIMSISFDFSGDYTFHNESLADGINWAWQNGADVISNSWWAAFVLPPFQILKEPIANAVSYGRNGKGCVLVFGSGNSDAPVVSAPARLSTEFSSLMAVGGITINGERASQSSAYSYPGSNGANYGSELDVVAPYLFITTTRTDTKKLAVN